MFLGHLGLAPLEEGPWPLKVSRGCLGILARVLLARQQKALHANSAMDIAECVTVWKRLINTLRDLSLQEGTVSPPQGNFPSLLLITIRQTKEYTVISSLILWRPSLGEST